MEMTSFAALVSALRRQFVGYCTGQLSQVGVTYGQVYILICIGKRGACSPKEIGQVLGLDAGHLNRTLAKLAEGGFVEQEPDPKDRRARVVRLTPKGEEIFALSHEVFHQWDEEVLAPLSTQEREQLMGYLQKLNRERMNRYE